MPKKKDMKYCFRFSNYFTFNSKIEGDNENLTFVRVDSDHIDNLIKKEETTNF